MMGRLAAGVGIVVLGLACACNAITGADSLGADEAMDEAPLPARHRGEQSTSSSSSGETLASSSSTSSGGESSSGEPTPTGDASPTPGDAGTDAPAVTGSSFFDPFTRADGVNLGNGWLEKTNVFSLAGGAARQTGTGSYRDLFASRPASEAALDVEISVDVKHSAADGDPCLYARMQPASATAGTLVSYTFYAYNDFAFLDRDGANQNDFLELASQAISPPFTAPYTYSLSLKVTGTNPVHLVAQVKDANGNVKVNLDVNDASPGRITTAGSVAFGSGGADGALFDNFKRTTF